MTKDSAAAAVTPSAPVPMSTLPAIVGVGVEPLVCWPDQGEPASVPIEAAIEPTSMFAALSAELDGHDELLAVVSDLEQEAVASARAARALLPSGSMALHVTSLPPLATGVLVAMAVALRPTLSGRGELMASLPALERELLYLTSLDSVTRLRVPAPSVLQHAQSFLPSSRFTVASHPDPRVWTAREQLLPPRFPEPSEDVSVVMSDRSGRESRRADELLVAVEDRLNVSRTLLVEPRETSADWWGSSVTEVVVFPERLHRATDRARARLGATCGWCDAAMSSHVCDLCGMAKPRPTRERKS